MFEKLLEPGRIGTMPLRNRILMGPTETHFTREDGCISQEEIAYYVERAKGGAALITTHQVQANTKIDPIDPYPRSARLDDDAFIPMMGELTDAVHLEGAKISVLLTPGGGAQALGVPYDAGTHDRRNECRARHDPLPRGEQARSPADHRGDPSDRHQLRQGRRPRPARRL